MGVPSLLGCVSGAQLLQRSATAAGAEPWELPQDSFPSQRLYRIKYRGSEGDFGFKLVLYLENETRYRMLATDLGRKLWSLSVDGRGEALWLDYRHKQYCRSSAASELRFVPLADLPLIALPKLLLGRLPAIPAASLMRDPERISFLDARGQTWNGTLAGDDLEGWSLLKAGEPVVWWRREEAGGVFSDRESRQEVRWQEIVREALDEPLADLEVPGKYEQGECDGAASG